MALLRKNPFTTGQNKPFYTLGLNKTLLIVGLGNIGKQYETTRHNVGFLALDAFANTHSASEWTVKKDLKCLLAQVNISDTRVLLCKPTTMMNSSGEAVQATANFYKIANPDVIVVHDELDIAFGQIRCRAAGGSAGHNGIKSIIQHLGTDFQRGKIGIGPKTPQQIDSANFVLANFTKDQHAHIKDLKAEVTAILTEAVAVGELTKQSIDYIV
jgi:peptidyl-tRNA hydrolase, PTH1 family